MNKTMKTLAASTLSALALMAPAHFAHAGDDYIVIRGQPERRLNDGSTSRFVSPSFNLPNVNTASISGQAILQMRARHVQFAYNSVYLNPVSTSACPSASGDPLASRLVGFLEPHGDLGRFTQHFVVPGSFLKSTGNVLMICARGRNGEADTSSINVDFLTVDNIVLHYKTLP